MTYAQEMPVKIWSYSEWETGSDTGEWDKSEKPDCGADWPHAEYIRRDATFTADDLRRAWEMGRDEAAKECDARGIIEQQNYGLVRGTQNFYRARDIIRLLPPPADLSEKVRK